MGAPGPKSVTKIKSKTGEVTFTSSVDRANYTIEQLCKAALRDCGKVIVDRVKRATPVKTGTLRRSWQKWVRKDKSNGEQVLQIGTYTLAQAKKKGQKYAHHVHLILLGHKTRSGGYVPGNNFFYDTVQQNLALIREVQAKYLSAIEDEAEALRLAESEEGKAEDAD